MTTGQITENSGRCHVHNSIDRIPHNRQPDPGSQRLKKMSTPEAEVLKTGRITLKVYRHRKVCFTL
jgi:hypothetical protein